MPQDTPMRLKTVFLASIIIVIIIAIVLLLNQKKPELIEPIKQPAPLTLEQQREQIIYCAALLAVNETAINGELLADSEIYNLISYALGKAQEMTQQMGEAKRNSKILYDEKTLHYFLLYNQAPQQYIEQHQHQVLQCRTQLQAFEPNAQIQETIEKAKKLAE